MFSKMHKWGLLPRPLAYKEAFTGVTMRKAKVSRIEEEEEISDVETCVRGI